MKKEPITIWLTGLPCSGKTTLAVKLLHFLRRFGIRASHLDGDSIRNTINSDLGFTADHRTENLRRVAHLCKYLMFEAQCDVVICSFISPAFEDRLMVRNIIGGPPHFVEVFVQCDLSECERRDVKGMYKEARLGHRAGFTVSYGYGAPDILLNTTHESIQHSFDHLLSCLPFYTNHVG